MDTQVCIVGGAYTGVNTDLKVWEGRCINRHLQYTECFLKTELVIKIEKSGYFTLKKKNKKTLSFLENTQKL